MRLVFVYFYLFCGKPLAYQVDQCKVVSRNVHVVHDVPSVVGLANVVVPLDQGGGVLGGGVARYWRWM